MELGLSHSVAKKTSGSRTWGQNNLKTVFILSLFYVMILATPLDESSSVLLEWRPHFPWALALIVVKTLIWHMFVQNERFLHIQLKVLCWGFKITFEKWYIVKIMRCWWWNIKLCTRFNFSMTVKVGLWTAEVIFHCGQRLGLVSI